MTQNKKSNKYDLEERTLGFAKNVIEFTKILPQTICKIELIKQLVRASGSVGANCIEANESLSRKDFAVRVKICRKECKESRHWLNLIETSGESYTEKKQMLINEATELMKIFGSIVEKTK